MVGLRLEKHCRAQYLDDYVYSWDTDYHRLLLDEDSPAKVRHADYTDLGVYDCGSSECGTYTETELVFILPWKDSFHDVIDGVCRGGLYLHSYINCPHDAGHLRYYAIVDIVSIRESDGNITSLGSYTTPEEATDASAGSTGETDVQYSFFLDIDNALVDENHRVGLRVRSYAKRWGEWGAGSYLRLYHTFNEDDTFVYLKYV